MDRQCKAESGLQLLARISNRPNLSTLNETLFPSGLNLGDVIEIGGDSGSGKTTLITQLLVKCLLPKTWNKYEIGGLGASAIIINTDHHFHLLKLVNLMESTLMTSKKSTGNDGIEQMEKLDYEAVEKIVKESLSHLITLNCYDSMQLFVTFHSLQNILSNNLNISLIIVDSMSAYYWQDALAGGVRKMDFYLKKNVKTLQSCIQEYKVVLIYTKSAHFQCKVNLVEDTTSKAGASIGNVMYKVQLNRVEGKGMENIHFAEIFTPMSKCIQRYTITSEGLLWAS